MASRVVPGTETAFNVSQKKHLHRIVLQSYRYDVGKSRPESSREKKERRKTGNDTFTL